MEHPFAMFDQVRIINLIDRADRRREMRHQLDRIGGTAPNIAFYEARRPSDAGEFPSLGARGCFESHLAVLKSARASGAESLLLLEDDFDFAKDGPARTSEMMAELSARQWDFFYGAHLLNRPEASGLAPIAPEEAVVTASFVGFSRRAIETVVDFLEGLLTRPAGSPDYGPMHVDGGYSVCRQLHPELTTFAAFPPLGKQRSSMSDITPSNMILDRLPATRWIANALRRGADRFRA